MEKTLFNLLEKRRQVKFFDNTKIPEESLIKDILKASYELTPSKQNLMPYKVHVLGPNSKLKNNVYELTMDHEKRSKEEYYKKGNLQVLAPYLLIIEVRTPTANDFMKAKSREGRVYNVELNPTKQVSYAPATEQGMFATTLTGLCIDNGLSVSYTGCIPHVDKNTNKFKEHGIDFIENPVLAIISIGYPNISVPEEFLYARNLNVGEVKPSYETIVEWHD